MNPVEWNSTSCNFFRCIVFEKLLIKRSVFLKTTQTDAFFAHHTVKQQNFWYGVTPGYIDTMHVQQ